MTTALQRLTKHTSATHSMHKSTRLATLALHNSPTNVSIVANTVAVGLGQAHCNCICYKWRHLLGSYVTQSKSCGFVHRVRRRCVFCETMRLSCYRAFSFPAHG